MQKYGIILTLILFLFAGCSSTEKVTDEPKISNEKNSDLAQELFINASVAEMKGDYVTAISQYQEALQLDPTPGINFALAKNFTRINKFPAALVHAKAAVEGDSLNSEYNYLLASIYQAGNEPDSAAIIYQNIIEHDSTDERAYYSLAQIYESTKPLKALELYSKLIGMIGPEWNVLINIADLNERMGNVEATIATLEELTEVDPNNLRMKKLLIESYLKAEFVFVLT